MHMAVKKKNVLAYTLNKVIRSARYQRITQATIYATIFIVILELVAGYHYYN